MVRRAFRSRILVHSNPRLISPNARGAIVLVTIQRAADESIPAAA
jgi:hypothetical protein